MKLFLFPLLSFCLFFTSPAALQAQELMPRLAMGATGGFHISLMDFGRNLNTDFISSGGGGFQLQYMSRQMLGFETGILFSQVGWSQLDTNKDNVGQRTITVLEFPLNSHLSLGKGPFRILVDAGPYLRFFLKEKLTGVNFPGEPFENKALDVSNSYGLSFSGGFGWRTPKLIVQLKGNFHLGLTNYFTPVVGELTVSAERSVGGSLSVLLPLGKKNIDEK